MNEIKGFFIKIEQPITGYNYTYTNKLYKNEALAFKEVHNIIRRDILNAKKIRGFNIGDVNVAKSNSTISVLIPSDKDHIKRPFTNFYSIIPMTMQIIE